MTDVRSTNDIDIHIGKRLRDLRIERGLTQTQLAEFSGVSYQQVQKYEKGTNRISASRLWKFCRVMDINLGYFFS